MLKNSSTEPLYLILHDASPTMARLISRYIALMNKNLEASQRNMLETQINSILNNNAPDIVYYAMYKNGVWQRIGSSTALSRLCKIMYDDRNVGVYNNIIGLKRATSKSRSTGQEYSNLTDSDWLIYKQRDGLGLALNSKEYLEALRDFDPNISSLLRL